MKKLYFVIVLIISTTIASADPDCDIQPILPTDASDFASKLQVPNCGYVNGRQHFSFTSENFCNCKSKFYNSLGILGDQKSSKESVVSIDVKKTILDELKKSLSANLLQVAQLRTISNIEGDFEEASRECNLKKLQASTCFAQTDLDDLQLKMSNELAHLVSPTVSRDNLGILNRSLRAPACEISDYDILSANSLSIEQEINDDFVKKLNSHTEFENAEELEAFLAENKILDLARFRSHPLFSSLTKDPKSFKAFFKGLSLPVNSTQINDKLRKDKTNNSKMLSNVAANCKKAFETINSLSKNNCSAINKNETNNSEIVIPSPISKEETVPFRRPYIDLNNDGDILAFKDLLKICNNQTKNKDAPDLNKLLKSISGWMDPKEAQKTYSTFTDLKYLDSISNTRDDVCSLKNDSKSCENNDSRFNCKIFKNLNKIRTPGTTENRISNTSDEKVNNLLRSMIGNPQPKSLDQQTRQILMAQGIIPQENGTIVAQPDVPERRQGYSASAASNSSPSKMVTAAAPVATASSNSAVNNRASNSFTATAPVSTDDSPTVAASSPSTVPSNSMANVDAEIRRRLSQPNSAPVAQPTTARANTQSAPTQSGTTVSAPQAYAQADQSNSGSSSAGFGNSASGTSPQQLSNVVSESEKNRRAQATSALSGMAGARASAGAGTTSGSAAGASTGRTPASVTSAGGSEAQLALNVSADAGEKKIAEVLKNFSESGATGEQLKALLREHKDFSFKFNDKLVPVIFDENVRRFTVADTAGIASAVRTQIESFLNTRAATLGGLNSTLNSKN